MGHLFDGSLSSDIGYFSQDCKPDSRPI